MRTGAKCPCISNNLNQSNIRIMKRIFNIYHGGLPGLSFLLFTAIALTACEKPEGPGGTSSISGTLIRQSYNNDYSLLINEKPAVNEDIFIIYGDDEVPGDKISTGLNGTFIFNYLRPGNYIIFYMSEDSSAATNDETEVVIETDLGRDEKKDLGTLVQLKTLDYNDGSAMISGVVKITNYTNESEWPDLVIKDISYAQEQEVYLTYGNHTFYDERTRTQYDGYFEFNHLIEGNYTVFLYSEDMTGATQMVTITRQVTITEEEQVVSLGEIMIEKH